MISRQVMTRMYDRFRDIAALTAEMLTDTDPDPLTKPAVRVVINEWEDWKKSLGYLFPNTGPITAVDRMTSAANPQGRHQTAADVAKMFDRTEQLLQRLARVHEMEYDNADK